MRVAVTWAMRIEGAARHLLGEEGAHLVTQFVALRRQAYLVELERGRHAIPLAGRDQRPELVRAARRDLVPELNRPGALVAEVVPPREHAQRVAVQDVLVGEADRAVHLMRDSCAGLGGFGGAYFRRGRFEEDCVVERAA